MTWYVAKNSTSETTIGSTPYTFDIATPTKDGSIDQTISAISMLSANGGALSASNFDAESDGATNTTDVTVSMDGKLEDSGGNILADETDLLGPTTYSVSVTNATSSLSASGTANTSGS